MVNLGIVVSEFNYEVTTAMLGLAKEHAEFLEAKIIKIVTVPGVYDMPLAVKKLLGKKDIDGVVTLGAVIEGQTDHDDIVVQHAARKITDLSLEFNKPVSLGISGPGLTRLEALQRVGYAKRAVETVVKMVKKLKELDG
ncbi:6,7-dimethyl-8-ribityllumazine synthase [archaeon BMS3Abin16]|nr:6,7-dimethyl-8-ribityllumazine synthase [archaeon BMS3Abin16]GBE56726.1 6,7-dimethyl-8-ribityllumazine synthase [archaeon BMS3Bbin16]